MNEWLKRVLEAALSTARLPAGVATAILLFLFAVQLLGGATEAAAPTLRPVLARVVAGDSSALGLSWIASYALANGSVVAALAIGLFDAGLVSATQLFLMLAGSRLGGAAIVVFVGALDYLGKHQISFREGVSMGLLTFLLTHSVYLPATAVGYLTLPVLPGKRLALGGDFSTALRLPRVFSPVIDIILDVLGPAPAFVLAVGLLFGSLRLLDRVLARVDTTAVRERLFVHFSHRWFSFGVGLILTTLTTSVAFSLGFVVPLYNRGYVERDELVPYVLGANLGTLFDTFVVAVVLRTPVGIASVLLLSTIAAGVTLLALVAHDRYDRAIGAIDDRLLDDRRAFVAFVASLIVGPLGLVVAPHALG